jgi:hypothetical protein
MPVKSAPRYLPQLGAALLAVAVTGCSKSQAQHVAANHRCEAAIAVLETTQSCPIAEVKFRVSVPGCRRSAGTFTYGFTLVNQIRKESVSRSVSWKDADTEWRQIDRVPLACDQEIYDVENVQATACSCSDVD